MIIRRFTLAGALLLSLSFFIESVSALQLSEPLVDTAWLAANKDKVVVLDVRTIAKSFEEKGARSGAAVNPCGVGKKKVTAVKVSGHIPGATLVPWKEVRGEAKVNGNKLKGMLLKRAAFDRLMKKSGVSNDSSVVIVHNGEGFMDALIATRLYWTMKYYGHDNLALLDGGTKKWITEKRKIEYGKSKAKRGRYKATSERKEILATADDVANAINDSNVQLLDNRGIEDYLGLTFHPKLTSADRKGHVPTAKNWSISTQVNTKGIASFYSKDDIKKAAEVLGVDIDKPTITYCWSGGQGSLSWFVMHELLGNQNVRLYDASMHGWVKEPQRPLAKMTIE